MRRRVRSKPRENWKPVPGFEGYYEVSDLGRVRSCERKVKASLRHVPEKTLTARIVKPFVRGRGYIGVGLWRAGKRTTVYVQRIVLLAFVGPPPGGAAQASHEPDPDPWNCRLDNLRWRSHAANSAERELRTAGASYTQILEVIDQLGDERVYGREDDRPVREPDPVLTGETPF